MCCLPFLQTLGLADARVFVPGKTFQPSVLQHKLFGSIGKL